MAIDNDELRELPVRFDGQFDLDAVVVRYQSALLRYVGQAIGKGFDEAQDVVQEVFIRLHNHVQKQGIESIRNPRCWLYRVAHNLAMDLGRRRGRQKRIREQAMNDPAIETTGTILDEQSTPLLAVRHEACTLAMTRLEKLPEEQRHVLVLKILQGLTLREISEIMNLKIGTVNYRLTQGLRTLAGELKHEGVIP